MGNLGRISSWLGINQEPQQPGALTQILPTTYPIGRGTDDSNPVGLDAVYRAIAIIQTAAAQLTLDVWKNGRAAAAPLWVENPDPWVPGSRFYGQTAASMAASGNAFWLVQRALNKDMPGEHISALTLLAPNEVEIDDSGAQPVYMYAGRNYTRRDIVHLALYRDPNRPNYLGMGPLQACRATISGAIATRRFGDQWLDTQVSPAGILTTDQPLTQEQAASAKTNFTNAAKARQIAVLTAGFKYESIGLTPAELQWIEGQRFNVTAIARMFGIPARHMLAPVDGSTNTYSNMQQEDLTFVRWTLMTYLREIEAAMTWLLPANQKARFNLDAILRPDTLTRYQAHKLGIEAGFLTIDEVRQIENMPPLGDAI